MKKEKMITRTIVTSNVSCITVDLADGVKTETSILPISGEFENNPETLKIIKKQYETDTYKIVAILSISISETLYGMPESVFIANAEILPARMVTLSAKNQ